MSKKKLPSIPPQVPPAQLPAATSGQLPAVAKATHPVRALKDFAASADELARHYGQLKRARRNIRSVRETPYQANAQKDLDEAGVLLSRHDKNVRELAKELELALDKRFSPDDAYDDDYQLTEERVRAAIALLLASFPNANPGNSEAYVGMMVEEVMAEDDVSLVVLESACSQIRRTSKFPPTTAEVIEAIREQAELWEPRFNAIDSCERGVGWMRDELTAAQGELTAATAAREERERIALEKKRADDVLRAQPLKVADRVRCCGTYARHGTGTIEREAVGGFFVTLDTACQYFFKAEHLSRLIPGDAGFELTDAKRAEIAQKLAEYDKSRANQLAIIERQRSERLLAPGDRVFEHYEGHGTVFDGVGDVYSVRFDNGNEQDIHREYLERRLPGWDDCGEPDFG